MQRNMKRKSFLNKLYILQILIAAVTFASCSDDNEDTGSNVQTNSYMGRWFLDWSNSEKVTWLEMDFDANGNFTYAEIMSSHKEGLNIREKGSSTYHKEGNTLVCRFDWSSTGTSSTDRLDITYSDKYTLVLTNVQMGTEETYSRIIDEYYIKAGETVPFEFKDSDFSNATFSVTDKRIATVDDSGLITAVKHGTTYITARASVGTVTVKVNVIDTEQPYTEYGEDLSLNKRQIIAKYGDNYMELKDANSVNSIVYYMGDMDTEAVNFSFTNHDKVKTIMVSLWESPYVADMTKFFEGKYERVGKEDNGFNSFYNNNGKYGYFICTDIPMMYNSYIRMLPDFEKYDELVTNGNADELAAQFGYTITEEDGGSCLLEIENGDMYEFALMLYDEETREIKRVHFLCKDGTDIAKATDMVKEFYPHYMDGLGYCASEYWWTLSPLVFVDIEENEFGSISIIYSKL